jgi:hypothetical protein
MNNECRFELQPLYCGSCGAFIGSLGTCEDYAVCDRCQSQDLKDYENGARHGYDLVYSPQFEKGKPPMHVGKV